jgi:hypothetical protein
MNRAIIAYQVNQVVNPVNPVNQVNPVNPANPNTNNKFTEQIILLIGSSVCMLISYIYKNWLKRNYKNLKKAKILSIKEFFKNKKYLLNQDVIVIGKYCKDFYNPNANTFSLMDHSSNFTLQYIFNNHLKISPDFKYIFNARKGHLEKNLINFDFIFDIFSFFLSYKLFQSLNLSFILHLHNNQLHDQYFLESDVIGVFGKATNKQNHLDPTYIFQGNSMILKNMLKTQISFWDNCFKFSAISIICQVIVLVIDKYFKKISSNWFSCVNKSALVLGNYRDNRQNCVKCKVNFANVVMNDCNHFNLCYKCFEAMDEKCQICNLKISDYYILCN